MSNKPPPVVILLPAEHMTPEQVRAYFEARHRALIVEDDWICEHFGFARKARGKKAQRYLSADKLDKQDSNGV